MKKKIVITGGSGLVGQILRKGLRKKGYKVEVFDKYRGWMVNLLRGKYFETFHSYKILTFSFWLNDILSRLERELIKAKVIKSTTDDILDARTNLAKRFRGSDVVIHLAAIPHPFLPGVSDEDYRRINYTGAVNVFEAAKEANVPKFVFASSVAAYGGDHKIGAFRIERFPILETSPCLTSPKENLCGIYGVLKKEFEDYLAEACKKGNTRAIALRLDAPGFRVGYSEGFVTSTSIENLIEGFDCALRNDWDFNFEVFNLVDREADPKNDMDVQKIIKEHFPSVPNLTTGNMMPFSTEKISSILGYKPIQDGSYRNKL